MSTATAPGTWGTFPFGRPNTLRPARMPAGGRRAAATVVGVYPSALHVTWTAPRAASEHCATGRVAALAVDVEPTVFWDGDDSDFASRIEAWKREVGFRTGDAPGDHGHVATTCPPTNGSSGAKVAQAYLAPLGISVGDAAFTDIAPVFHVKGGRGGVDARGRREQGDAIRQEYEPLAELLGLPACTLPRRPSEARLCGLAAATFRDRLLADLEAADAPLVVTLGREVWTTFMILGEIDPRPPAVAFDALRGDAYGSRGTITIGGRRREWLPLVHPGLLRGTTSPWSALHAKWIEARA